VCSFERIVEYELTRGNQVLAWLALIGLVRVRRYGQAADPRLGDLVAEAEVLTPDAFASRRVIASCLKTSVTDDRQHASEVFNLALAVFLAIGGDNSRRELVAVPRPPGH
jgi:hypothetical protein